MSLFNKMVDALYRERHSVEFKVSIPADMFMALETLVYLRNNVVESGKGPVDRDLIVGLALSNYLTYHLTKGGDKVVTIPEAPPRLETSGRRQARYQDYQNVDN